MALNLQDNTVLSEVDISMHDLLHYLSDFAVNVLFTFLYVGVQVPVGAILHKYVDIGLGPNNIVAFHDVWVPKLGVDLTLPYNHLLTDWTQNFEVNDFHSVDPKTFVVGNSFIDSACKSFAYQFGEKDSVFADFDRSIQFQARQMDASVCHMFCYLTSLNNEAVFGNGLIS